MDEWRRIALLALLAVLSASPVRAALEPETVPSRPVVRYADGRLSVRLERVPLDLVMAAVERESGLVVRGELRDWREVTKRFDDVPIARALARLLGRQNFVLRYDADGNPLRIDLLGLPGPVGVDSHTRRKALPGLAAVFGRQPPVRVPPPLRPLLRKSSIHLTGMLAVALRHHDPTVRAAARGVLIDAFETRHPLRAVLRRSPPDRVAEFLRPWPAVHVDELLRDLATRSRDPALRGIARSTELAVRRTRAAAAVGRASIR